MATGKLPTARIDRCVRCRALVVLSSQDACAAASVVDGPHVFATEAQAEALRQIGEASAAVVVVLAACDHPEASRIAIAGGLWCEHCGAIDLSPSRGKGFIGSAMSGRARRIVTATGKVVEGQ